MTPTPDRIPCPTCEGRRFLDIDTRAMHAGARCGKDITLRFQCDECGGRGTVDERVIIEQAAIDADKAAFEATLPDYIAHAHERIAAGDSPF